jgi:hypothetical protein
MNNDNLLTLYLREASMLQPTFVLISDSFTTVGMLIDIIEDTKGRGSKTEKILLQIEEAPLSINELNFKIEFSLDSSGSIKFNADAIYIDGLVPVMELSNFTNITIEEQRQSKRIKIENAKNTFVIVESISEIKIGSFKLNNISSKTIGGHLLVASEIPDTTDIFLSGRINLGGHSISVSKSRIIRIKELKSNNQKNLLEYEIAISIKSRSDENESNENRRLSERTPQLDIATINLKSNLGVEEIFNAQLVDISAGGFSAKILNSSNRLHILPGSEIYFAFSNLRGRVIDNSEEIFRVKWDFEDTSDKITWSKFISSLIRSDIVIGSYENESVLTLLARSGIKSATFLKNYHTLTSMVSEVGDIDSKGNIVSYKWINKNSVKKTIAHVGAFKIADNLWFMGDLFASLETEKGETKNFVKEYLSGFIDFSNYVSPYPKILTAWTPGHPYWKTLEQNLEKTENKEIVHSSVVGITLTPDVCSIYKQKEPFRAKEIKACDLSIITDIRKQGERIKIIGFLDAFNFCPDTFASPHLKSLLRTQGYKFLRHYYKFKINNSAFLVVISSLPEGLSPQRHQSAVWIFSLSESQLKPDLDAVVKFATLKATEISTFPSVIRIIGKGLNSVYSENLSRMVIADPKIWSLT